MKRLLTAAVVLCALPAPAGAATVQVEGGVAVYSAGAGELNNTRIAALEGGIRFDDFGAAIAPGPGCRAIDEHSAQCDATSARAELGDGNDVAWGAGTLALELHGGADDDQLAPAANGGILRGGEGDDYLLGGTVAPATLDGGPGHDVLRRSPLGDTMTGGEGDDAVEAGPGRDTIDTGAGDDRVDTRDGEQDSVACGEGNDLAIADEGDTVAADCVDAEGGGPSGSGPATVVEVAPGVTRSGVLRVTVLCPPARRTGCEGELALRVQSGRRGGASTGHTIARRGFAMGHARRRAVNVRIPRTVLARLRRGERISATAVASTLGVDGTSSERVVLRLR